MIVTENLFGDILSDLAAGLIGGMGMAPSADIGDYHAVFQPCHGTAPDMPTRDRQPCGDDTLMRHAAGPSGPSQRNDAAARAARRIESAVALALADGRFRTADIGGQASTQEVTSAILAHLVER